MGRMGGVLHDTIGFAGASCKENIQDGGERGTDDLPIRGGQGHLTLSIVGVDEWTCPPRSYNHG